MSAFSDPQVPLFTDAPPLEPGFLVVHANQPEQLRALVVHFTKAYPLGVLETEFVLVQSNGIAQWLKLALAADTAPVDGSDGGLGIASCLSLQMPGRFIWQLYRSVLGAEHIPEHSVFDKDELCWRLFKLLPKLAEQTEFQALAGYLADDTLQRKQHQLALRLADLFDQYQVYRADWLQAWSEGKDVLIDARGGQKALPESERWQAALWRAVLDDVPDAEKSLSRALLHHKFLAAASKLNAQSRPKGLPRRVIVFGISSLPQQMLEALAAIAPYTQVLLAVHNPCQHYWADIVADKDLLRRGISRQQPKQMPVQNTANAVSQTELTQHPHGHPLLAAWGKQGRDYIALLDQFDQTQAHRFLFAGQRVDLFSNAPENTLLGQLQNDILELRPLAETRAHWPVLSLPQAQSICFATAHSAMREIEILHDDLLAQFSADPSLKPADVMVMVPDINQYAAAIAAVFGRFSRDDARYIPFTVADQSALTKEPLLQALQTLLNLQQQRFTVSTLLDLLQLPALQQKFGLTDADLPLLQRWIEAANIRWGLHENQRESLGLPGGLWQNSWQSGLQRMLLGYAVGDSEAWLQIAPLPEVSGLSAELAGKLARLLALLEQYWQQSQLQLPPKDWVLWLQQLLADFFLPVDEHQNELLLKLQQGLHDWQLQCQRSGLDSPLCLAVVAQSWLDGFERQGLAQRFLAGAVNFATLMPMRAIPFAQIHLLGMNDGDFPRKMLRQDFDLMAHSYRPGDRSRRDDDRYLLLEALLSARKRLRISWVGHSVHDNSERPPSVLIAQLRDHLASGWQLQLGDNIVTGDALLDALTVQHPLQAFSRRYLGSETLTSYQHEWLALHQPKTSDTPKPSGQAVAALALPDELPVWDIGRLTAWLKDPVKFFFRQRLKIQLEYDDSRLSSSEDFSLDALQRWQLQQRLQQQLMQAIDEGKPWQQILSLQLTRLSQEGLLPLAGAGDMFCQQLEELLSPQAEAYQSLLLSQTTELLAPLYLEFGAGGQQCGDWLRGLRRTSDGRLLQYQWLVGALYKNKQLRYSQLLSSWLQQLLCAANGHPLSIQLLAVDGQICLPPVEKTAAIDELTQLFQWISQALCRPLPVEFSTALLYLQAGLADDSTPDAKLLDKLTRLYQGDGFNSGRVEQNRYLQRAYPDFAALWQQGEMAVVAKGLYQGLRQYLQDSGILERG